MFYFYPYQNTASLSADKSWKNYFSLFTKEQKWYIGLIYCFIPFLNEFCTMIYFIIGGISVRNGIITPKNEIDIVEGNNVIV